MQQPRFWSADAEGRDAAHALQAALRPLSWAYAAVTAAKLRTAKALRAPVPVICIGNLTVGGVGKTPIARAMRRQLSQRSLSPHLLLRGYGGRLRGPHRVLRSDGAREVGDEALLHALDGPTWISRDRAAGAMAAAQDGADIVLMDDGFQNPSLQKDLSFLVFDAAIGVGNGRVLPAGPMREPLDVGLARADAVILMRSTEEGVGALPDWLESASIPVLGARIAPLSSPPSGPLLAFAGIGRPEKFFRTLVAAGGEVADAIAFPDHHPFVISDIAKLVDRARLFEARLITTEKDFTRLPEEARAEVAVFPVEARFDQPAALEPFFDRLPRAKA